VISRESLSRNCETFASVADMRSDPDSPQSQRAMTAMLKMKKLDIAQLERAYSG